MARQTKGLFPIEFSSSLLRDFGCALRRRSKAIRYHARLSWEREEEGEVEYFEVWIDCHPFPVISLGMNDEHAGLLVSEQITSRHGGAVLRIEKMRLVRNGEKIVAALESTCSLVANMKAGDNDALNSVRRIWEAVTIRVI